MNQTWKCLGKKHIGVTLSGFCLFICAVTLSESHTVLSVLAVVKSLGYGVRGPGLELVLCHFDFKIRYLLLPSHGMTEILLKQHKYLKQPNQILYYQKDTIADKHDFPYAKYSRSTCRCNEILKTILMMLIMGSLRYVSGHDCLQDVMFKCNLVT